MAALHLHDMGDGVDRPGHARRPGQRLPADRLGLVEAQRFLEAEGVVAKQVRVQSVVRRPGRQHALDTRQQRGGVAAIEVDQQRPLQGQRIAWMVEKNRLPCGRCCVPVAARKQAQGVEMGALARVGVSNERLRGVEEVVRFAGKRRLGEAEQKAGLHRTGQ